MIISFIEIIAGFLLLIWGADRFVLGAAAIARNLGVSPLIVGLTIVGFGTSAPEMLVSGIASWKGSSGLAIGNALGSNIANIALVLGVVTVVIPLTVHSKIVRRELPIMLLVMLVAYLLVIDGELSQGDGLLLFLGMGLLVYWVVGMGLRDRDTDVISSEFDAEMPKNMAMKKAILWTLIGMAVLFGGSQLLVDGAVMIARALGVSDLIIGLTIIAIGTSLPELAASVMGALKNEHDIAIGNIIGSNMFNLLGVLSLPGLISPGSVVEEVIRRDFPIMIGLGCALFVMAYGFRGHGRINRVEGATLVSAYVFYLYLLYQASV